MLAAAGCWPKIFGAPAAALLTSSRVPHCPQKEKSTGTGWPQLVHRARRAGDLRLDGDGRLLAVVQAAAHALVLLLPAPAWAPASVCSRLQFMGSLMVASIPPFGRQAGRVPSSLFDSALVIALSMESSSAGGGEAMLGGGEASVGAGAITVGAGAMTVGAGAITVGAGAITVGAGAMTVGAGAAAGGGAATGGAAAGGVTAGGGAAAGGAAAGGIAEGGAATGDISSASTVRGTTRGSALGAARPPARDAAPSARRSALAPQPRQYL